MGGSGSKQDWVLFVFRKDTPTQAWKMWLDLLVEGLRFTTSPPTYSAKYVRIGSHSFVLGKNTVFRHHERLKAPPELQPRNPVKALFVPITETQMAELQALSERGCSEDEKYCWICLDFFYRPLDTQNSFQHNDERVSMHACIISQLSLYPE